MPGFISFWGDGPNFELSQEGEGKMTTNVPQDDSARAAAKEKTSVTNAVGTVLKTAEEKAREEAEKRRLDEKIDRDLEAAMEGGH